MKRHFVSPAQEEVIKLLCPLQGPVQKPERWKTGPVIFNLIHQKDMQVRAFVDIQTKWNLEELTRLI